MIHVISALDLSVDELDSLLTLAEEIIEEPTKFSDVCNGKKLATCFYEPSTRTRLSFESAKVLQIPFVLLVATPTSVRCVIRRKVHLK